MAITLPPTPGVAEEPAPQGRKYGGLSTLGWLDSTHPEYDRRKDAWERDERRIMGGDAVLDAGELVPFDWEEKNGEHYRLRKSEAVYINLPRQHASLVTGHLTKARPMPGKGLSLGTLGDVRERTQIDTPSRAELMWYNIDGIGNDGSQMVAWLDGVDIRAQATGHRWIMVEAPDTAPLNYADELAGMRPFAVEYSPLEVTNWHYVNGVLQWAIVRAITIQPTVNNGMLLDSRIAKFTGYYLLVRKGWEYLGPEFAAGGWWLFDYKKEFLREGKLDKTKGQIPLFPYFGRLERGSTRNPDISASDTMELGQLAIEMMNTRSARKYDFWDACSSKIYFLGATNKVMNLVVDQWKNSQLIGVPTITDEETGEKRVVQIYDGSTGAVTADVADKLEASQWEVAKRLSMEKVTSAPQSSGESKNAGFAEASAPDLARRAQLREQGENQLIYFFELRWGFAKPRGFSQWRRDYDLQPLEEDIDAMFKTLRQASISSSTAEIEMLMQSFQERGIITDPAKKKKVEQELTTSAAERAEMRAADTRFFGTIMGGKAPIPAAQLNAPANQPTTGAGATGGVAPGAAATGAPPFGGNSTPSRLNGTDPTGTQPGSGSANPPAAGSSGSVPAPNAASAAGSQPPNLSSAQGNAPAAGPDRSPVAGGAGAPRPGAENQGPPPVVPDNQGRTPPAPERAATPAEHAAAVAPVVREHIAPLQQSHDALTTQVQSLGTQLTTLTTQIQELLTQARAPQTDPMLKTMLLAILALLASRPGVPPDLVAQIQKAADGSTSSITISPKANG